jgi:hypothetical protein
MMPGYWGYPVATAETIDPTRWLHTGYLGTMDQEGCVKVTGRIKDMDVAQARTLRPGHRLCCGPWKPQVVDVLLNAGADITARSNWWAGPFGVLYHSDTSLAPHLISRGATVDIHPAAEVLLDHGAKIDARDLDHGGTPAQHLIRRRPEVARYLVGAVELLLEYGASVNGVANALTPLHGAPGEGQLARYCRQQAVADYLTGHH